MFAHLSNIRSFNPIQTDPWSCNFTGELRRVTAELRRQNAALEKKNKVLETQLESATILGGGKHEKLSRLDKYTRQGRPHPKLLSL